MLDTHKKSAALQSSMRLFQSLDLKQSPYRSPRLQGAFTDPLVIKSIFLKNTL